MGNTGFILHHCLVCDRGSIFPIMLGKIVSDAVDGIRRLGKEILVLVAIAIDCKMMIAGRHELSHAHGPGIRALGLTQEPTLLISQFDVTGKLLAEVGATWRIVKTQGVECVQNRVSSHLGAILGFYANDGHYDGRRDLPALLGLPQDDVMFPPETDAIADPAGGYEDRSVLIPGLGFPGAGDGIDCSGWSWLE